MKTSFASNERGMAMVIVIVVIIMLTLVGSFMANLSYNQRRILNVNSGKRVQTYYLAQAGVVDAIYRIRNNVGAAFSTNPAATLTYSLDVNADGTNDTNVTIGAVGANGLRPINSTGLD